MNGIVNEMVTLINHSCKWIAKSGENVVVEELHGNNSCVGVQSPHLHPLNGIINGD
jgi:hypothetical protein